MVRGEKGGPEGLRKIAEGDRQRAVAALYETRAAVEDNIDTWVRSSGEYVEENIAALSEQLKQIDETLVKLQDGSEAAKLRRGELKGLVSELEAGQAGVDEGVAAARTTFDSARQDLAAASEALEEAKQARGRVPKDPAEAQAANDAIDAYRANIDDAMADRAWWSPEGIQARKKAGRAATAKPQLLTKADEAEIERLQGLIAEGESLLEAIDRKYKGFGLAAEEAGKIHKRPINAELERLWKDLNKLLDKKEAAEEAVALGAAGAEGARDFSRGLPLRSKVRVRKEIEARIDELVANPPPGVKVTRDPATGAVTVVRDSKLFGQQEYKDALQRHLRAKLRAEEAEAALKQQIEASVAYRAQRESVGEELAAAPSVAQQFQKEIRAAHRARKKLLANADLTFGSGAEGFPSAYVAGLEDEATRAFLEGTPEGIAFEQRLAALDNALAQVSAKLPDNTWATIAEFPERQRMLARIAAETGDSRVVWMAQTDANANELWAIAQANSDRLNDLAAAARLLRDPKFQEKLEPSLLQGFADIGSKFQGEEWVKDALDRTVKLKDPFERKKMMAAAADAYDAINLYFKAWAVGTPGFVVRNLYGAVWNNAVYGIKGRSYH